MSMTLIEHYEVPSGGITNFTFSSIPQTYTDLYCVFSLRSTLLGGFADIGFRLNGATTNYSGRALRTRSNILSSVNAAGTYIVCYEASGDTATSNAFGNGSLYISNYTSSNAKSISAEGYSGNNSASDLQGGIVSGLWDDSAAVTSLTIIDANGEDFMQYSSFTLYGITAGSDGTTTVS